MSSGFISETDATELRKKRQEEWERVRKPSDPIERPEEPFDGRSLYDRLKEQKDKKDLEFEEAHKLKNMIKGLDDDEIEFLDLVDRTKLAADRKKEIEEEQELRDYRNRVALLQEKSIQERLQAEKSVNKPKSSGASNQQKLLKGVVIKKTETPKRKMSSGDQENSQPDSPNKKTRSSVTSGGENTQEIASEAVQGDNKSALKCVAILPGLGHYNDSSSNDSSDDSDDSELEHSRLLTDLLAKKGEHKTGEQGQK